MRNTSLLPFIIIGGIMGTIGGGHAHSCREWQEIHRKEIEAFYRF